MYISLYFLCRYFLSFFPSVRMFPSLMIPFVPFKNITDSVKVYVKYSNTVPLRIDIKRILNCKICSHSKYFAL